ncbi:C-type lectin domain family 12 member B-like [Sinocyclocheilus rhinocerous]|uniref:C-type lectin domain family 12 member B-like n=1 Tax=Sinocyclocheilus rhinocerous TaxID=307959 RepID=UPI0007B94331|nr:PREDICTED: C-type lectin domain family 12 member B-like [Sinocyclocheilus rhinocerous]
MFDRERSETPEVIYNNVDTVGRLDLRVTEKQQPLRHTGSVSVKNRTHRAAEVCLCLLCFLLLTAVIVLCVCFTSERKQLLTHISNLTEEREHILTKYEQVLNHSNNLTEERVQLRNDKNRLHSWLYEQDQQGEPYQWIYYNFSFYYISSEKKSWSDSSRDCQQRGADLVIINKDGEEFLQKVVENNYFWIGLINTESGWEWSDGTITPNG